MSKLFVYYQPADDLCKCIERCVQADLPSRIDGLLSAEPLAVRVAVTECIKKSLEEGSDEFPLSELTDLLGRKTAHYMEPLQLTTDSVLEHQELLAKAKEVAAHAGGPRICACIGCMRTECPPTGLPDWLWRCLQSTPPGTPKCCTSLFKNIHLPLDYPVVFIPRDQATCAICLEDFVPLTMDVAQGDSQEGSQGPQQQQQQQQEGEEKSPDRLRKLPCHHIFHPHCVDRWVETVKMECPTCSKPANEFVYP